MSHGSSNWTATAIAGRNAKVPIVHPSKDVHIDVLHLTEPRLDTMCTNYLKVIKIDVASFCTGSFSWKRL